MSKLCANCSKPVSPKAFDCPACGHPLRKPRRGFFGFVFKWLLIVFNVLMVLWVYFAIEVTKDSFATEMSDAETAGAQFGATVGFAFLFGVWVVGDIILGLLTLLTRPRK